MEKYNGWEDEEWKSYWGVNDEPEDYDEDREEEVCVWED